MFDSFQSFSYNKPVRERAELIKPYMHWLDENRLTTQVEKQFENTKDLNYMYSKAFGGMRKINRDQLITDTLDFYHKDFPKELAADMFNLYNKSSDKLDYEGRSEKNIFRYKVLDKILDPIGRMISEGSSAKSMIMTKAMIQYFCMMMAYQKQVDEEEFEKMKQCLNPNGGGGNPSDDQDDEEGEGDSDEGEDDQNDPNQQSKQSGKGKGNQKPMTPEEALEKLLKNDRAETLQEALLDQAKETIAGLNEIMDDQEQEELWQQAEDPDVGFDKESINALLSQYRQTKMSMDAAAKIIRKLLDKSKNYFNGKETTEFESLFESSSVGDIVDLHLLHPKLRKLFADDIMVKNVKREGKINVYIDVSGSMNSWITMDDTNITGLDFAKSFVIKMMQMNLVEKVFAFDTSIMPVTPKPLSVSTLGCGGGTSIRTVVRHIEKEGVNAIVITDAEDQCDEYSPYAYFIGILGARFTSFTRESLQKYAQQRQIVEFDGVKIHDIDERGRRTK